MKYSPLILSNEYSCIHYSFQKSKVNIDLLEFGIRFMIDVAFGVQDSSLRECMLVALLQETNAEPISTTQTIKRRWRQLLLPPRVAAETRIQSLKY
jgi:hypothetical protein